MATDAISEMTLIAGRSTSVAYAKKALVCMFDGRRFVSGERLAARIWSKSKARSSSSSDSDGDDDGERLQAT